MWGSSAPPGFFLPTLPNPSLGLHWALCWEAFCRWHCRFRGCTPRACVSSPHGNRFIPAVKRIGRLMLPAVFGSAVYQFNQFVGTLLASFFKGRGAFHGSTTRIAWFSFPWAFSPLPSPPRPLPSLSGKCGPERAWEVFKKPSTAAWASFFLLCCRPRPACSCWGSPLSNSSLNGGAFGAHSSAMTNDALMGVYGRTLGLFRYAGAHCRFLCLAGYQNPGKGGGRFRGSQCRFEPHADGTLKTCGACAVAVACFHGSVRTSGLLSSKKRGLFTHVRAGPEILC